MSRELRVMHVVLSLEPGGTERLVIDISRRMNADVPTSVCCLDQAGAWAPQLRAAGIPVAVLGRRPGFHPALGLQIAELATAQGASVVHCHQYSPFVYGSFAGMRRPSLRIVFTEHGRLSDDPPKAKRIWANRVIGWWPDSVVAVSDDLRRHMIAEGFPPSRIDVIHNGIEPGPETDGSACQAARRELGVPADAFLVGTVARLDPVKGLEVIVQAFSTIVAHVPEARLVLVGDGPERQRLEELAVRLGVASCITWAGFRSDARALMAAFDVYVNTSTSEGVSLTLLEAMAASRAVVATRVGGTPEVIVHGTSGLLVPARDPGAVAETILALHQDAGRRQALGAAGRSRVVERFSFDRLIRNYLAAYEGRRGDH